MLNFFITLLLGVHIVVSLLIILVTLMQRPKSEGLGAAFGGGMTENIFGAQTTNVLANFTRWMGGVFFGLTLLLSILYAQQSKHSGARANLLNAPKPPAATPAPKSTEKSPAEKAAPAKKSADEKPAAPVQKTETPKTAEKSAEPAKAPEQKNAPPTEASKDAPKPATAQPAPAPAPAEQPKPQDQPAK